MEKRTASERIDNIFNSEEQVPIENLRAFVSALTVSHEHASKMLARYSVSFILLWTLFYAIGAGFVAEGQVGSFQIRKPLELLIVAPVSLGGLFYLAAAAASVTAFLSNAIGQAYKYLVPGAYEANLEEFCVSPSLLAVERFLDYEMRNEAWHWSQKWWLRAFALFLVFGSFAAIAQAAFLLWQADLFTLGSTLVATLVGGVLWVRGLFLVYSYGRIV